MWSYCSKHPTYTCTRCGECVSGLVDIVDRLAYPDKYVDTSDWFSGDGPFESYCDVLQIKAQGILKRDGV